MPGTADEHQEDAVDVLFGVDGAVGFEAGELGEAEAEGGKRSGVEKVPATGSVAEFNRAVRIEAKHRHS